MSASRSSEEELSEEQLEEELKELAVGEDGRLEESAPSGGFWFNNEAEVKRQRKAVMKFVRQLGKNFFMGKDLVSVSMPVSLFEPRSFLQRITDNWCYLPIFLDRAASESDPLERFKLVITFAVAGLHCTCIDKKPFNPILGETYEAKYEDGTEVYCEQTCHHPPVSHWQVIGKEDSFRFTGYASWSASFRGNSIKGQQSGPNVIAFPDDTVIEYHLPYLHVRGVLWGPRVIEYGGKVTFTDHKNNLRAEIKFDADKPGFFKSVGSFFTRSKRPPSDLIRGEIVQVSRQANGKERTNPICKVQGTWLGYVEFSKAGTKDQFEKYWEMGKMQPVRPIPVENPLPSDCRYREDLIKLAEGDEDASQEMKVMLEEKQRRERRLREQYAKAARKARK